MFYKFRPDHEKTRSPLTYNKYINHNSNLNHNDHKDCESHNNSSTHNNNNNNSNNNNSKLKIWEIALILALCLSLCYTLTAERRQQRLTDGILRLHVIAASDDDADQQLKIRVRDAVTDQLRPLCESCVSSDEAESLIVRNLSNIEKTARDAADGESVHVDFGRVRYGMRVGDGCTLPAGVYRSLRITLGEGRGHNWWGVLFPQLLPVGTDGYTEAVKILGKDNVALIIGGEESYELRFKTLELLEEAKARLENLFSQTG